MENITKYKGLLSLSLLVATSGINAQPVANPSDNIPAVVTPAVPVPLQYPGLSNLPEPSAYNYVRTQVIQKPVTTLFPLNFLYYTEQTNYFDGLGRPLQSVSTKAGPEGKDLVQQQVYDGNGRQAYLYLPIAAPTGASDGKLKTNIKDLISGFYSGYINEQPYSETRFDNSPLNRITKQLAPGKNWVGADRGTQVGYKGNTAAEGIRRFTIGYAGTDMPVSPFEYSANELMVTQTTDEDGKYALEYTDKMGKLILKKNYLSGSSPAHDGFACTYYVYDGMDRLRFVIPPEAVAAHTESGSTWNIPHAVANGLCYRYLYDTRGRMIEKKIPGKDAEYFVYDQRDRKVLYQDGKLRAAQGTWSFTIYDGLDRPATTGLYKPTGTETRTSLQGYLDNATSYPAGTLLNLLKNYTLYQQYPASLTSCQLLSYTYYDNYNELVAYNFDPGPFSSVSLPSNGTVVASVRSNAVKGLVTGTKIRIVNPDAPNSNDWLTTANFYDDDGRLIQSQAQNHKGGLDVSSNIYFFQGMLWKNIQNHQNPAALAIPGAAAAINNLVVTNTFERNLAVAGGNTQVIQRSQAIGNFGAYPLAGYTYDQAGRLVGKQTPAGNTLQEYNIRGFLDHIQISNPNNTPGTTHIFEENLYYDEGFGSKLYNGNIAGITWKKAGNTAPVEAYGYSYDNLDRLNHAEYRRQPDGTTGWTKGTHDYTASNITYDLNGNIKTMDQRGLDLSVSSSPVNMDQLSYSYAPNSNQLIKVTDVVPPTATPTLPDFKDKANLSTEYTYDVNGNLIADANKQINSISYDPNNKPERIDVQNQGTITYVHDAASNVLQKKVHTNATGTDEVYDYVGNFVYKNNVLQYILNEEGRARPVAGASQQTNFVYDYFVKDHLGNVRSTITAEPINQDYLATHEIASANIEQLFFDNIPNVRDNKPGSISGNDVMAAGLDGSVPTKRVGTAIMLKTMPGDRFSVSADAFYEGDYEQSSTSSSGQMIESLMSALLGGNNYSGVPLAELPENVRAVMQTLQNPALAGQLDNLINTNNNPNAPKAHLNVLFFNDKMELVPGSSATVQVATNTGTAVWNTISAGQQITSPGAGYVLIYIDNQSTDKTVWMDNVLVQHYTSEVLEEEHYYPFGLTVQTSQAVGATKNDIKFQSQKHENDLGINMYSFKYREHDPQIGRFWQIDPLSEKYIYNSTYAFSENKLTSHIELEGLEAVSIEYLKTNVWREAQNTFKSFANWIDKSISFESKTEVKTKIPNTNKSTVLSTTKTANSNFGEIAGFITANNSNKGLKTPWYSIKTESETSIEISKEFGIPVLGNGSVSTSINQNGTITVEGEGEFKTKTGLNVSVNGSANSEGQTEVGVKVSAGIKKVSVNASASGTLDNNNRVGFDIGMGMEYSTPNTTISNQLSIKFGGN